MFSDSCRISDEVKILHLAHAGPGNAVIVFTWFFPTVAMTV
jgi:hypothetical protein